MRAAFAGVDTLLLVSAAEHPERVRQHLAAVDAAAAAGVRRVVYTSFLGAGPDATFTLGPAPLGSPSSGCASAA